MKKVIISLCFLQLISSFDSNLNLKLSVEAKGLSCIENNESLVKIISDPSKREAKLKQIKDQLYKLVVFNSSLTEKIQLKGFTKQVALLNKLLSELISHSLQIFKLEINKIQAFTTSLNLNIPAIKQFVKEKNTSQKRADPAEVQALTEKIFGLCEDKLCASLKKIMIFLNPAFNESINQRKIKKIISKMLSSLTSSELDKLEDMVSQPAFKKITDLLDEAAEITIGVLSDN